MKLFSTLLIISCLLFSACEKEEGFPDGNDHPCDHMLGSFAYLPSSVEKLPFEGKHSVHFIDTFGNELTFTIQRMDGSTNKQAFLNVWPDGRITYDCYESLPLIYTLQSESTAISFSITLMARPSPGYLEEGYVADWLTILRRDTLLGDTQVAFFDKIIDRRTSVEWPLEVKFDFYTCFGRTFLNVTRDPRLYQGPIIFYNDTEGIVSFLDASGKKWCFDRFE